jgi:hypothetical protein
LKFHLAQPDEDGVSEQIGGLGQSRPLLAHRGASHEHREDLLLLLVLATERLRVERQQPSVAALQVSIVSHRVDPVVLGLSGFCLLMVSSQIRLLPLCREVPFFPARWAFTFS